MREVIIRRILDAQNALPEDGLSEELLNHWLEQVELDAIEVYEDDREPDPLPEEIGNAKAYAREVDLSAWEVDSWEECPGCGLMGQHRSDCQFHIIEALTGELLFL